MRGGFVIGPNFFRKSAPADLGMEDVIYGADTTLIPMSAVGTGLITGVPPGLGNNGAIALNKAVDSGLPGIIIPSFRTQPLSPQNPAM